MDLIGGKNKGSVLGKKSKNLNMTGNLPTEIDPWIVEHLSLCAKREWVSEELDKKIDSDLANEKFKNLRKQADEATGIMFEHKQKISKAPRPSEIEQLRTAVTGWSGWFRKIFFSLIFFIMGSGGTAIWNYSALNSKVENLCVLVNELKESISQSRKNQKLIEKKIEFHRALLKSHFRGVAMPASEEETLVRKKPE